MESRQKTRQALLGHAVSKKTRDKISEAGRGRVPSREAIENHRAAGLRLWKDSEYVAKVLTARQVKLNKAERQLGQLIGDLGFRFVGDGQLIVNDQLPDFWDGESRVIELYGDYWHAGDDPEDRVSFFRENGYDCLVIWEQEA